MSLGSTSILRDRAIMMAEVRSFFFSRDVCEVDCPILNHYPAIDVNIDPIETKGGAFLHTSPEYGMKRLLSEGMGDIYQLSHVFRDGEIGHKHNPEFMMIEWYRLGFDYEQIIEETAALIELFLGEKRLETISYRDALKRYAGFDYIYMSDENLLSYMQEHQIPYYPGIKDRDEMLNLILGVVVEPKLGIECLTALTHYPATQAALARIEKREDEVVAYRYEIYHEGMELANGYWELTNAGEQRSRFQEENRLRMAKGKRELPVDENFIEALQRGVPECCGVAVGFDRLMMLRHRSKDIGSVVPFSWPSA